MTKQQVQIKKIADSYASAKLDRNGRYVEPMIWAVVDADEWGNGAIESGFDTKKAAKAWATANGYEVV